jgi:hypothetical protein
MFVICGSYTCYHFRVYHFVYKTILILARSNQASNIRPAVSVGSDAVASRRALRGVEMTQHHGALSSVNTLRASVFSLHVLTCTKLTEVFMELDNEDKALCLMTSY